MGWPIAFINTPIVEMSGKNMNQKEREQPIGVFDSGLGGLTVVKALRQQLSHENVVYFGDTARVPYGTKSPESIIRFSKENVAILLKHDVKMIVVACNSSTSHALPTLRKVYSLPIVGVIEPGVRKALAVTRNKRIGVIATPATVSSEAYVKQIHREDAAIKVVSQACPLFVPLVEEGWYNDKVTLDVAKRYLEPILEAKADTLILGCTHYPLLKTVLKKVMGTKVSLIDSAQEVAREVKSLLLQSGLNKVEQKKAHYQFFVSDEPKHFGKLARRFLGYDIKNVNRVMSA